MQQNWLPAQSLPTASSPQTSRPSRSWRDRLFRFVDASNPPSRASALEQLSQGLPPDRLIGWITTLSVTALAFFLRWVGLGFPGSLMFDEVFYAKDGWSLWQQSYEGDWSGGDGVADGAFASGDTSYLTEAARWATHPPVGSWIIGLGERIFGVNAFGWRFMSLLFGCLMIFLVIRLTRRMTRSTLIAALAGVLLCFDGLNFVMSRIALLDIFQATFLLAAVAAVVADRDYFRNRLARHLTVRGLDSLAGKAGPVVFRPWLWLAGLMFGLSCATKWNSVYPLAVFAVLSLAWSIGARRLAGAGRRAWWGLLSDGLPAFVSMVLLAAATYLACWIPWLLADGGYDRQWGVEHPDDWVTKHFGTALSGLWRWHVDTYGFHTGLSMSEVTHAYGSNPWGWPIMLRTIGIYAENDIAPGDQGCLAAVDSTCMRVVTGLGTPILWWLAAICLVIGLIWWLAGMDWRFGVVILGMASTWVPWLMSSRGAMFSFYAICMIPFMVIGLAMVLGVVLGPARTGPRRQNGAIIVTAVVCLVIVNFAFNYPVLTGELLTRQQWQWRMWLTGWI
jgi:dolichyl-phosphate-mannose--protein O-mannosyl transferase